MDASFLHPCTGFCRLDELIHRELIFEFVVHACPSPTHPTSHPPFAQALVPRLAIGLRALRCAGRCGCWGALIHSLPAHATDGTHIHTVDSPGQAARQRDRNSRCVVCACGYEIAHPGLPMPSQALPSPGRAWECLGMRRQGLGGRCRAPTGNR